MDPKIEPIALRDVHCDMLHPDKINGTSGGRHIERVAHQKSRTIYEAALRQIRRGVNEVGAEVDAKHRASEGLRKVSCGAAQAATHVQNEHVPLDAGKLGEVGRCSETSRVKLVDGCQILR